MQGQVFVGPHGECGARTYNEGLCKDPQRGAGEEPLIKGSEEAASLFAFAQPEQLANLS